MNKKNLNSIVINEIKLKMHRFDSSGPGFSHSLQPYPMNIPQDLTYFQRSFELSLKLYSNMYYSNKPHQLLKATKKLKPPSFCTLFCGNLHEALEEKHLMFLFRHFQMAECSKNWKNFGFVSFYTEDEACKAYVALNGRQVMGRPMRLEFQNKEKKNVLHNSMKISQSIEFINSRIQKEFGVANRKVSSTNDVLNENTLTETLLSSIITSLLVSTAKSCTNDNDEMFVKSNESKSDQRNTLPFATTDTCGYSSDSGWRSSSSQGNADCSTDEESDNTSDDASDIPTSSDYLNDLDALNSSLEKLIKSKPTHFWYDSGKVYRKKLEPGVYCSTNETTSLFSGPLDILVKVDNQQIKDYALFPASN